MKISYFQDTDTLFVLFSDGRTEDTRDLDENTLAEYDRNGNLLSLTMEHTSKRADVKSFSFTNPSLAHAA